MPKGITLGKIEKEVEKLTPRDQLKLLERLARLLRKARLAMIKEIDWKGLYGLGKDLS
ncbi:MAG: hypothetical protein ACUVWN_17470 [bacterium]